MASWPTDPAKADEALTPALRNELDLLRVDGRTQCPGPGCRVQADKNHFDTAFYPQRGPSEHKRGFIAMEYTTMQDPGAAGGRTKARKADKPRLTMAATDKDMALGMLKEAARQIRNMPSKKDVHFQCMFMKEGTSMVEQENERVAKWRQTLPTRNNYTDEHVQRNTINPHAVRNPDEPLPPSP